MTFIKNFRNLFPSTVTTIIVILITLYTFYQNIGGINIFDRLANILPVVLIGISIIGLTLAKQSLASHVLLLITSYLASGRALIVALTSFDFQTLSFQTTWTIGLIINAIIFVYLVLYVLSFILDGQFHAKLSSSPVLVSALIAFLFFYVRDGFSGAVLKILPPMIALLFGSSLYAIVLLLAGVIDVPFRLLSLFIEGHLFHQTLGYYLFAAFALFLIYGAIKGILQHHQ
jgi:hypothetical protein